MDYQNIRLMMSQGARKMGLADWKMGASYVCSTTYVREFIKARPELAAYKSSHIDLLRSKKATTQVHACVSRWYKLYQRAINQPHKLRHAALMRF